MKTESPESTYEIPHKEPLLCLHLGSTFFLTANIFESGPMPTPQKFLAGPPLLLSCKLGQNYA
jgi:hypothetical protein